MLRFLLRAGPVGLLCLLACSCVPAGRVDPTDDFGPVGAFRLTERSGKTLTQDELRGKVWVASFQFTRCTSQCPQISQTLGQLQGDLADRPDVRLVTFTVDPDRDTVAVLDEYADRYKADPERWLFLTGAKDDIYTLLKVGFHVYAAPTEGEDRKPGNEFIHTPKLVVVDRNGHVRGYYDGLRLPGSSDDPEAEYQNGLKRLRRQVDRLLLPESPRYLPSDFPAFNALLNTFCAILILFGYQAIRLRLVRLHSACMLAALTVSALFLASYLYFHLVIKGGRPTRFVDQAIGAPEWLFYLYQGVLLSHTILAVVVTPLVLVTAWRGLRGNLAKHVRLARWALPIWLYVSVTGVGVYWMLYRLYP